MAVADATYSGASGAEGDSGAASVTIPRSGTVCTSVCDARLWVDLT